MELKGIIHTLPLKLFELLRGCVTADHDRAAFDLDELGGLLDAEGVDIGDGDAGHDEDDAERLVGGFDDVRLILLGPLLLNARHLLQTGHCGSLLLAGRVLRWVVHVGGTHCLGQNVSRFGRSVASTRSLTIMVCSLTCNRVDLVVVNGRVVYLSIGMGRRTIRPQHGRSFLNSNHHRKC